MTASEPTVALIPKCAECGRSWLPDAEERWQAHLGIEERRGLSPRDLFRVASSRRACSRRSVFKLRGVAADASGG
jgi:hypothetical protein